MQLILDIDELGLGHIVTAIIDPSVEKQGLNFHGHVVLTPESLKTFFLDVVVITENRDKEIALSLFSQIDERLPQVIMAGESHFSFQDPVFEQIRSSCLVKSIANGYSNSLIHIYQSLKYLTDSNIKGNVAEFGIYKGGTTVFIAKALEHFGYHEATIYGFDSFAGFLPRRSLLDLYADPSCEFRDTDAVVNYFRPYKIEIVQGDICETYKRLEGIPLMLSFFDTDNYSPTRTALELCFEQTVKGGILAFDHYISEERFIYTIGERIAAQEILKNKSVFHLHGTGIFLKL